MLVLLSSALYFFVVDYLISLVFAYTKYYNMIIGRRCSYVEKYFSKYKWTDLFWILFVILTCLLAGNSNLYPLPIKKSLIMGAYRELHLPYSTCYLLISFYFESKINGEAKSFKCLRLLGTIV